MFIHVDNKDSQYYVVIDAEFGNRFSHIIWADDEKDILCKYLTNDFGNIVYHPNGKPITLMLKRKIKFIKK